MNIRLTPKAGDIPLASFLAQGWTADTLVLHGYAAPCEPVKKKEEKWKTILTLGGKGEAELRLCPNPFGLTDPAEVKQLWAECSSVRLYPHGYSFEQQILFVAERLLERVAV